MVTLNLPHPNQVPSCNFEFVQVYRPIIHEVQTILTYINTYFRGFISLYKFHLLNICNIPSLLYAGIVWQVLNNPWIRYPFYVYTIDIEVYTSQNYILFQTPFMHTEAPQSFYITKVTYVITCNRYACTYFLMG